MVIVVVSSWLTSVLQVFVCGKGNFSISESDGLQILCGDFFALRPEDLGKIDAVYDRASLVALPYDMRIDYPRKIILSTKNTKSTKSSKSDQVIEHHPKGE